jgi:phasin family protein
MLPLQEQILVATKANLDAQFAMYASLTSKTLEGIERIVNLNISAAKASMEESAAAARQLLAAKDPQEMVSLVTAQAMPTFEKTLAYSGHLVNIASSTQSEFNKAAEVQLAEVSRKMNELVDEAAKKSPAGSESVMAIMKSALGNANASYEQLNKTTRQAMEVVEANIASAVAQMSQVGQAAKS